MQVVGIGIVDNRLHCLRADTGRSAPLWHHDLGHGKHAFAHGHLVSNTKFIERCSHLIQRRRRRLRWSKHHSGARAIHLPTRLHYRFMDELLGLCARHTCQVVAQRSHAPCLGQARQEFDHSLECADLCLFASIWGKDTLRHGGQPLFDRQRFIVGKALASHWTALGELFPLVFPVRATPPLVGLGTHLGIIGGQAQHGANVGWVILKPYL